MHVETLPNAMAIGRRAADLIADDLRRGALHVLGVATGSSPSPLYKALQELALPGWSQVQVFALDEYIGLGAGHPQSYRSVIDREVRRPLSLSPGNVHVPDGDAPDLEEACADYERQLKAHGGVDIQVLGIGATGHIGFNEPGSPFASRTRPVALSDRTRADNARFFDAPEQVPHHAVTQGIATITEARRHVLIACGSAKAEAVRAAVEGKPSPACPASALQGLPNVTVLLDPGAGSALSGATTPQVAVREAPRSRSRL